MAAFFYTGLDKLSMIVFDDKDNLCLLHPIPNFLDGEKKCNFYPIGISLMSNGSRRISLKVKIIPMRVSYTYIYIFIGL